MGYYLTLMQVSLDPIEFDTPVPLDQFAKLISGYAPDFNRLIKTDYDVEPREHLVTSPDWVVTGASFSQSGHHIEEWVWNDAAQAFAAIFREVTGHSITGTVMLKGEDVFDIQLGTFADSKYSFDRCVLHFPNAGVSVTYEG